MLYTPISFLRISIFNARRGLISAVWHLGRIEMIRVVHHELGSAEQDTMLNVCYKGD